jgi:hypothetical protein
MRYDGLQNARFRVIFEAIFCRRHACCGFQAFRAFYTGNRGYVMVQIVFGMQRFLLSWTLWKPKRRPVIGGQYAPQLKKQFRSRVWVTVCTR